MTGAFGRCSVAGATLRGVEALPVQVEVAVSGGLPGMAVVGMPDAAVQEARERVRAAIRAAGFAMPNEKIVVSLAPGDLRKTGTGFDLPIAVGILVATGQLAPAAVEGRLFVGELSLEGRVRPASGALAFGICARDRGLSLVGSAEAARLPIAEVEQLGLERLSDLRPGGPGPRTLAERPRAARARAPSPSARGPGTRARSRTSATLRATRWPSGPSRWPRPAATGCCSWGRRAAARRCSPRGSPPSCRR